MASTRTRQPRQPPDVRRRQALDAALELIGDGGYRAASMEAIARRMGVAKTVVYAAFPTLEALLLALMAREEERAQGALRDAVPEGIEGSPSELLASWVRHGLQAVVEHPATWRLVLRPTGDEPAPVRERIERGRRLLLAQIGAALGGLPTPPRDPEVVALAVLATAERAAQHVLDDPAAHTPERWARFAVDVLEAALRT